MQCNKRRHRHFLFAPILALLVVLTISQSKSLMANVGTDVLTNNNNEEIHVVELSDETKVMLFKGAGIEDEHITNGQALVSTQGYVSVEAGPYVLKSVAGGFHVTVRDQVVTVAAISAPVLVQWEDQVVLVPVGLQWRGREKLVSLNEGMETWFTARKLKTVPIDFRREQLTRLSSFDHTSTDVSRLNTSLLNQVMEPFQLSASRERSQELRGDALLDQISLYVTGGDQESAHALLMREEVQGLLLSDRGISALAALLSDVSEDPLLSREILTSLLLDVRLWLLLSVHPDFRSVVWSMERPALTKEEDMVYLITLPQSDILPDGLQSIVLERWQLNLSDAVEVMEDPSTFLAHLFDLLIDLVDSFHRREYPQRASLLTNLLLELVDLHSGTISDEQRDKLLELKHFERVDVSLMETEEVIEDVQEEPKEEEGLTPDEVKSRTYELLRSVGALFTVETVIEEISPVAASVRGILFSTSDGERSFEFQLNVLSGEVFGIVQNGEASPFSLPLEEFAVWARK
ncbi:hypothetical protein KKF55_02405 [Patescibacteria group bacterium]|nr:hypothetical protein [Patescibacteria group bacterium]